MIRRSCRGKATDPRPDGLTRERPRLTKRITVDGGSSITTTSRSSSRTEARRRGHRGRRACCSSASGPARRLDVLPALPEARAFAGLCHSCCAKSRVRRASRRCRRLPNARRGAVRRGPARMGDDRRGDLPSRPESIRPIRCWSAARGGCSCRRRSAAAGASRSSAVAGLKDGLRAHLWFGLDRPFVRAELGAGSSRCGRRHARVLAIQIHYIAAPVFADAVDDPCLERLRSCPATTWSRCPPCPSPGARGRSSHRSALVAAPARWRRGVRRGLPPPPRPRPRGPPPQRVPGSLLPAARPVQGRPARSRPRRRAGQGRHDGKGMKNFPDIRNRRDPRVGLADRRARRASPWPMTTMTLPPALVIRRMRRGASLSSLMTHQT